MKKPVKAVLESIIVGIINAFLGMVLFFIPVLNISILLFPVPIIVVGVRQGTLAAIISLAVSSVIMGLFTHPFFGIIIFCLNIFIVLALIAAYKEGYQMNESVVLSSGGALLSMLVSLQAFTWMAGESFFDFLWDNLKAFFSSNSINIEGLMELYRTLGKIDKVYPVDRFAEIFIGQMKDLAPLFPSLLLVTSLLLGGLNFLVSRLALKRMGSPIPNVPPFKSWSLPRGTGRGFLWLMIIATIGTWIKIPNFEVVLYTISSVFTFVFTVQGLSVVSFLLAEKRVPGVVGVLILIAAFVFLSVVLTFMGIFEQMFGFRRALGSRKGD